MRIHRIHLQSYRGVGHAEVRFPDTGVTIVEGDNEVGKSSLAESLDLVFRHRDSSTHREVKAVQPVHHDEGPQVEVEVSTGPYRFTYAKRWLRQKHTTLTVHEPVRQQLNGREAHDRVQAMLDETLDTGLWDALRLQQGAAADQAHLDVSSLSRALDAAAGGERTGEREDLLWERATAERARFWTATGKPSTERLAVAKAVESDRARVAQIRLSIAELDDAAEEVGRLAVEAADLEADQVERAHAEGELQQRAKVVAEHREQVERASLASERAETELTAARAAHQRRVELVHALEGAEHELARCRNAAEQAQPATDGAQARARAAEAALSEARRTLAGLEVDLRLATDDRDDRRRAIELDQFRERFQAARDAEAREAAAVACLESSTVDQAVVRRIDAAHAAVLKAEGALGSDATRLEVVALRDHRIQLDGDPVALSGDESLVRTVTGAMQLVVADVARIEITPDASSRGMAEQLADAQRTLDHLCAEAGVASLDEAREVATARAAAEQACADARTTKQANLRDLSFEQLAGKIQHHEQRLERHAAERPADPPAPVDLPAAQARLTAIAAEVDAARDRLQEAERARQRADAEVADARVDDAGLAAHLSAAEAAAQQAATALQTAREATTDEVLERACQEAEATVVSCATTRTQAQEALAAHDPDTLEVLLQNATAARQRAAEALRSNRDRQHHLRGLIEARGGDGLGQQLDDALTSLEHHEREHRALEARAAAALLLHDTLRARRDEARDRYVAPFRERIEQLGRLVYGPSLQVELDAQLDIASRTLHGVTVPFASLSTGTKEQLGILSRLACAAIVSSEGGAPVVLDDALGWTDPARLDGMGAAISVAGRDCQVIVLTCTPGRYASVGEASVVPLRATSATANATVAGDQGAMPVDAPVSALPFGDTAAA